MATQLFSIPMEDKLIIYRPLLRLAFVGNRAMADLALRVARDGSSPAPGTPDEALAFLQSIGFLEPDPPPPAGPCQHATTAVLLLTNRCNLRCTYCYANGGEQPAQDLYPAWCRMAIDRVCRNAAELGASRFDLTFHGGGEPVQAWKTLGRATAYARGKELACHISMVSNGVWTVRQRDWLLHNLDSLSISFDGAQTTQDRQRPFASGRGSFQAVMRSVEALDKAGFSYGIRMTATAPWQGRLPEDVRFLCEHTGCQAMQVEPAFNTRRGEHRAPTWEESRSFVDAFMEAFEIASRAGRSLTYSGARPWLLTRTFCTAPYGALIVNPDGRLVACYEIAAESHPLAKLSTLGHIAGERILVDQAARKRLLAYLDQKRATCQDCFCYWHCAGDCYTRSFAPDGADLHAWRPRCFMNREITARILLWYIMAGDGVWRGQGVHPQSAQLLRSF